MDDDAGSTVVGEMEEVAMIDDLVVTREVELGPDDVPPTDDDESVFDDEESVFDEGEMMADAAEGPSTATEEAIEDLSAQQLTTHSGPVFAAAVNAACPAMFATGGGDDVAFVWQRGNSEPVARLTGHAETVGSVAFSADGAFLATGGLEGAVRVWSVSAGQVGNLVIALEGPTAGINWVRWHNRGAVLLAGSEDATAWMWKLPEGSVMQIFSAHSASVSYGGFVNGGRSVITASEDGTVRLWNPRAGTVDHCIHAGSPQEPLAITCLSSHDSQPLFLFGAESGALKLGHADSGKVLAQLGAHDHSVESTGFCDCMNLAASAAMDGRLCIWDLSTLALRHTCQHDAGVVELRWRRESPLLLSCGVSRDIRLWDARDAQCLKILTGHRDAVLCMAVGYPDSSGMYVVSGSDDHSARVWEIDV